MAYKTDYTLLEQVIQMLAANKDNKFSRVIEIIVNEAMKLERAQALQAEPYAPLRSKGFGFIAACAYIAFSL